MDPFGGSAAIMAARFEFLNVGAMTRTCPTGARVRTFRIEVTEFETYLAQLEAVLGPLFVTFNH
jgi:hypothetical protein